MWYFPLLKPLHDHVPVKADLSDLAEKITWCRDHDDECRQIGENAKAFYEKYVARTALLDYLEMVCKQIAKRYVPPPEWWEPPSKECPPPQLQPPDTKCFEDKKKRESKYCKRCREEYEEEEEDRKKKEEEEKAQKKDKVEVKKSLRERMKERAKRAKVTKK
jgi:hypothetical protein